MQIRSFLRSRCVRSGLATYLKLGISDRLRKEEIELGEAFKNVSAELELKVEKQTETLRKQYRMLQLQAEKLRQSRSNVIDILGTVVEYRNLESGQHIERVKGYTRILAERWLNRCARYMDDRKFV